MMLKAMRDKLVAWPGAMKTQRKEWQALPVLKNSVVSSQ
jgi:hypothetical protein